MILDFLEVIFRICFNMDPPPELAKQGNNTFHLLESPTRNLIALINNEMWQLMCYLIAKLFYIEYFLELSIVDGSSLMEPLAASSKL